jgi:cytochrome c556
LSIPALSRSASITTVRSHRSIPLAIRAIAAFALFALLGASATQAADDKAWIEYRQKVMSSIGADMGGIGDILKNGLPLTPSIEYHALAIAQSSNLVAPAFQQKVVAGATDAKAEIWSDPAKFKQAIEKMQSEAELLAAAVGEGNVDLIPGRVKALGQACGGCHESFRKPKEESYKNK